VSIVAAIPAFTNVQAPTSVQQFAKYEVAFGLSSGCTSNLYDNACVDVSATFVFPGSSSIAKVTVSCFPYQVWQRTSLTSETWTSGSFDWRCRFATGVKGAWTVTLAAKDASGSKTSAAYNFNVIAASTLRSGYAKVSTRDKRYFDHTLSDGSVTTFWAVGEDLAWVGGSISRHNYSQKLFAVGAKLARVWVTGTIGDSFEIEKYDLGQYNNSQKIAAQLDMTVEEWAAQNGKLQFCLLAGQSFQSGNDMWNSNVYNTHLHLSSPTLVLSDPTANKYLKRRFRYIIARWGYSPAMLGWELFNEADQMTGAYNNETAMAVFHQQMADFIRASDPFHHPVTTSIVIDSGLVWNSMDYYSIHHYNAPDEAEMTFADSTYLHTLYGNKPVSQGESGTEWNYHRSDWNNSYLLYQQDPTGLAIRNWAWSSLFAAQASSPLPWWWDVLIDRYNQYWRWNAISKFVVGEDLAAKNYQSVELPVSFPSTSLGYIVVDVGKNTEYDKVNPWGRKAAWSKFTADWNTISPPQRLMPPFFYGANRASIRSPGVILVNLPAAGTFQVVIDNFGSTSALIYLDGVLKINHALSVKPTTLSLSVPSGPHNITIDSSYDWFSICQYHIPTRASPLRAYALVSSNRILGWVKAINHTWHGVYTHAQIPSSIAGGKVTLSLPAPQATKGDWSLVWWDTEATGGAASGPSTWSSPAGVTVLTITLPTLTSSIGFSRAFKLIFTASTVSAAEVSSSSSSSSHGVVIAVVIVVSVVVAVVLLAISVFVFVQLRKKTNPQELQASLISSAFLCVRFAQLYPSLLLCLH